AGRALRAVALDLLASLGAGHEPLLWRAYTEATDMTSTVAALEALGACVPSRFDEALADYHERWRHRPLVLDKWFTVQATAPRPGALARVERLLQHPDYAPADPNRVRALVKAFAQYNLVAFHGADGAGYRLVAAVVAATDPRNPTLASALLQPFADFRRFDATRRAQAEAALRDLLARPGLSPNAREMLERTLG
ncbi:MAG: DUF3458 domain-containing protein, partial [Planctomycetes bacterium]|nr:DUF3458 domain-containing protein [Planctomycetota bacterium]